MSETVMFVFGKYLNIGVLGIVLSIVYVVATIVILLCNWLWCNEKRLARANDKATRMFVENNHINGSNYNLFKKSCINSLPMRVRNEWKRLVRLRLDLRESGVKSAIDTVYESSCATGFLTILVLYVLGAVILAVSGSINVFFNSTEAAGMGVSLVLGAVCILVVTLQMCWFTNRYSGIAEQFYCNVSNRLLVDNVEEEIVLPKSCVKVPLTNKVDKLIVDIREYMSSAPDEATVQLLSNCLQATLDCNYCSDYDKARLIQAYKLLK